jgi:hypothetical protein
MGNTKTGTLGKLSRRVRRNTERAMKARGKREKAMQEASFVKGVGLGAELRMVRLLNATAGYEYEADQTPVQVADVVNVDDSSESTLGSDLMAEDTCPSPEVYGPKLPA